jgi:hypothetical protein
MKSVLIFASVAGFAIAGAIYYLKNKNAGPLQVINVEDGFAMDA